MLSVAGLSWVLNAYNIVFAALLVPAGRLADLLGRRRLFFIGLALFVVASVSVRAGSGRSRCWWAARVLQAWARRCWCRRRSGCCCRSSRCKRRATATGAVGRDRRRGGGDRAVAGRVADLVGGTGGWCSASTWGWARLAWVPARRLLRETRDPDRGAVPDALGIVLLACGCRAVSSLAIVEAPSWGWASTRVLGALLLGVVAVGGFIWRSAVHPHPVLELALFRVRSFAAACTGVFVFSLGFYAVLLANILFLTGVWDYTVAAGGRGGHAGAADGGAVLPRWRGGLIDRYGQRVTAVPGGLLLRRGLPGVRGRARVRARLRDLVPPGDALDRDRRGPVVRVVLSAAVMELPPARFATGSAISSCFRQLGAVLGISVLIAIVG